MSQGGASSVERSILSTLEAGQSQNLTTIVVTVLLSTTLLLTIVVVIVVVSDGLASRQNTRESLIQGAPLIVSSLLECARLLLLLVLDGEVSEVGLGAEVSLGQFKSGAVVLAGHVSKTAVGVGSSAEEADDISHQLVGSFGLLGQHLKGPPAGQSQLDVSVRHEAQQVGVVVAVDTIDNVSLLLNTEAGVAEASSDVLLKKREVKALGIVAAGNGGAQNAQLGDGTDKDGSTLTEGDVRDGVPRVLVHERNHGLVGAVNAALSER